VPASDSWIAALPSADVALTPRRDIDIKVLRKILDASREGVSVDVFYQSMNKVRPDPIWRRITPHAFGYDGFRWHARAYCHLEHKFKDFLLPRILDVGAKASRASRRSGLALEQLFRCHHRPASCADGEPEEGCRQGLWAGSGKWRARGSLRDALLCFEASGFAW
jgi:hypothetical protein